MLRGVEKDPHAEKHISGRLKYLQEAGPAPLYSHLVPFGWTARPCENHKKDRQPVYINVIVVKPSHNVKVPGNKTCKEEFCG